MGVSREGGGGVRETTECYVDDSIVRVEQLRGASEISSPTMTLANVWRPEHSSAAAVAVSPRPSRPSHRVLPERVSYTPWPPSGASASASSATATTPCRSRRSSSPPSRSPGAIPPTTASDTSIASTPRPRPCSRPGSRCRRTRPASVASRSSRRPAVCGGTTCPSRAAPTSARARRPCSSQPRSPTGAPRASPASRTDPRFSPSPCTTRAASAISTGPATSAWRPSTRTAGARSRSSNATDRTATYPRMTRRQRDG